MATSEPLMNAVTRDHYHNPRNVGRFAADDPQVGTGMAGAPDQGAVVRLQVQVDASGIINDTRFKAYGCGSTIAAASWVSELLKGKTLDQALAMQHTDIMNVLDLPPVKIYCAMVVLDATQAAIGDYRQKQE